jgi:transposase
MITLDEYVPEDHLLRAVDRDLDLSEFRLCLADSRSHTGRPSIDPELLARMLIIGYCYGSERQLCEEVGMNLAYRWFCRLGLKDKVPGHSSFPRTDIVGFAITTPFAKILAALEHANSLPPPPKRISLTDPAATWTAAAGPAVFTYATNYLIDRGPYEPADDVARAIGKTPAYR